MKTITNLTFITSLLIFSCTRQSPKTSEGTRQLEEEKKYEITKEKIDSVLAGDDASVNDGIKMLQFDKSKLPSIVKYRGHVVDGAYWNDKNGDNILFVTQSEVRPVNADEREQFIYAYHYINREDGYSLLWTINDYVRSYCDVNADHIQGTLEIVDVDKDGSAESLFIYKLDDRCDVSPIPIKLMMHSGDKKLIIRGSVGVEVGGGEKVEGEKHIDAAFNTSPPAFKEYASKKWDRFVKGYKE